jgi:hypothetical protein
MVSKMISGNMELGLTLKQLRKNSFFRIEHYNDVTASGEFYRKLWSFKMRTSNYGNNLNNSRYFEFKGVSVSYTNDLTNALTLVSTVRRNSERAMFDYDFRDRGRFY